MINKPNRDGAWDDAAEWLLQQELRCEVDCHMVECDDTTESLAKLLRQTRLDALEEAKRICQSQVPNVEWDTEDEYRRGQKRGAHDCVTLLQRLIGNGSS